MMTNTYTPHRGGVARSVESFTKAYRALNNRVLVVAPEFEGAPLDEPGVIRVPAIQHFNGSDFSVSLPIIGTLSAALDDFNADIVHSHHPFLLGDTAYRVASNRNLPLVFTHHTLYEDYTHYVPGDSPALRTFAIELSTGYANLCDHVIAPSKSIKTLLTTRGVKTPITVLPTGVDVDAFAHGDGDAIRRSMKIPEDAVVIGHVGRLAAEKNLAFLSHAVVAYLKQAPNAVFLLVGSGPAEEEIKTIFRENGLSDRLHLFGSTSGQTLVDCYHAMNLFVFSSMTETQGLVIVEAMAAGLPIVAIDASGVRDVPIAGCLLQSPTPLEFADAIRSITCDEENMKAMKHKAFLEAKKFSIDHCAKKAIALYEKVIASGRKETDETTWSGALRMIESEWNLWKSIAHAAGAAVQ